MKDYKSYKNLKNERVKRKRRNGSDAIERWTLGDIFMRYQVLIPLIIVISAFLVLKFFSGYLTSLEIIKPSEIKTYGNRILSHERIIELAGLKGKNVLTADFRTSLPFLSQNQWIKEVSLRKMLPNKILVLVEERIPVAYVKLDDLKLIDGEGFILDRADYYEDEKFITIEGLPESLSYKIGEKIPYSLLESGVDVLSKIKEENQWLLPMISEIDISKKEDPVLTFKDGVTKVLLGQGEIEDKLRRLKKVVSSLGHEPSPPVATFDLRFKDRVVVKKTSAKKRSLKVEKVLFLLLRYTVINVYGKK